MDDFTNLFVLCILMFVLTFIIGYLPMIFKLSESKLESISIFGAGFLLGTALIVIVPEGLSVLMETSGILQPNHEHDIESGNGIPVNVEQEIYEQLSEDIDIQNINADLEKLQNNRLLLHAHDHDHQNQPNPVILVDHSDDAHSHSHSHEHAEEGHHHTHDPIVHSVFRKMGCLICFG